MNILPQRHVWPSVFWAGEQPRRILLNRRWASEMAWGVRPAFLRSQRFRKTHLFAGPWVGEFGWELMGWQGLIRALRTHYDHITVCARESSAALYTDCCDAFVPHQIKGQSNAHVVFDVANPEELTRTLDLVPNDADHLRPLRYVPLSSQSFVRFGDRSQSSDHVDVLLHARGNAVAAGRNWPREKWLQLVTFLNKAGLRVGAIGLSSATLPIEGISDFRDQPLEATMNLVAGAKMVVGPSSGPMHLASLCGTPHIVWTDRRLYSMRRRSRDLYERFWNPLGTSVEVIDEYGFDPPVEVVSRLIEDRL